MSKAVQVQQQQQPQQPQLDKITLPGGAYNGQIFEAVYRNGKPQFLTYDQQHKKFRFVSTFPIPGNKIATPFECDDDKPYIRYSVDDSDIIRFNQGPVDGREIYRSIRQENEIWLDLEDKYRDYSAIETFETYHQHKLSALAYPWVEGEKGSGKPRLFGSIGGSITDH